MRFIVLIILMIICNSCFLFSDFKRTQFPFLENGGRHSINAVVPKKYTRSESQVDSVGNQVQYYYYRDRAVLYFAFLKDTSTQLQSINYDVNIPKQLYETIYFKGLDSSNHYWRETRFGNYKTGYKNVEEDDDGRFDSSINYFSLHLKR